MVSQGTRGNRKKTQKPYKTVKKTKKPFFSVFYGFVQFLGFSCYLLVPCVHPHVPVGCLQLLESCSHAVVLLYHLLLQLSNQLLSPLVCHSLKEQSFKTSLTLFPDQTLTLGGTGGHGFHGRDVYHAKV